MKVAFLTLGCKVNFYDSEAMAELFKEKGYEVVSFDDFAHIYIVNTCTVTNFGDKKSRQMLRRAKRLNPEAVIVAAGCYSQTRPEEVSKIEGVNIVIGTKDRSKIVQVVEEFIKNRENCNLVSDILKEREFEHLSIKTLENRTRAYLKIQEGCNRFCSYCIIPYARGPIRSRDLEDIVFEVNNLAEAGFKEIVLTGIHVASYGLDLKGITLIDVIKAVSDIEGIERIRLSSVEPLVITDEFIEEIKKLPKVCPHYHLSLQSGSDEILGKMNRRYTTEDYRQAVLKLRKSFPTVSLTTDIIVGFPQESEDNFRQTCDFAKEISLSKIHVFPYSKKEGTRAAVMKGHLPKAVKEERAKVLGQISKDLSYDFYSKFIGKKMQVLFERSVGKNMYQGHTDNYILVEAQSSEDISNTLREVEITGILSEDKVSGRLL